MSWLIQNTLSISLVFLVLINSSSGQDGFSYLVNKNISISDHLQYINNKYQVNFAFESELNNVFPKVSGRVLADDEESFIQKLGCLLGIETKKNQNQYLVRTQNKLSGQSILIQINDWEAYTPLAGCLLFDAQGKIVAISDSYGECYLPLTNLNASGKFILHTLGYQDQILDLQLSSSIIQVKMKVEPLFSDLILIKSYKKILPDIQTNEVNMRSRNIESTTIIPLQNNDLLRSLQSYGSIQAFDDTDASIRIRNSHEEGTLLLLDKMPVYKSDHFYGIFGVMNGDYIDSLSLFKNSIPSNYGGRMSGMLALNSSNKIEETTTKLSIDLLSASIVSKIKLSDNIGLKIGGRKSWTNLTQTSLFDAASRSSLAGEINSNNSISNNLISTIPDFNFYDFNTKLNINFNKNSLTFNGFVSADTYNVRSEYTYKPRPNITNTEKNNQDVHWENKCLNIVHSYQNKSLSIESIAYSSNFESDYQVNNSLTQKFINLMRKDSTIINNLNQISTIGLKSTIFSSKNKNHFFGIELIKHEGLLYLSNDRSPSLEIQRKGWENSAFGQVSHTIANKLTTTFGIRTTYLDGINHFGVLPNILLSYYPNQALTIKASSGKHLQLIRQIEHENALGQRQEYFVMANGKNIPYTTSVNNMVGFTYKQQNFTFDMEAFYRWQNGSLFYASQQPNVKPLQGTNQGGLQFKLYNGKARTYGIDFSLYYQYKRSTSMLFYTISKSENRFAQVYRGDFFPSQYDSRHQLKWINSFKIGRFDLSASYIAATGRPYLDLAQLPDNQDRNGFDRRLVLKNLPAYHRVDIGIKYNSTFYKKNVQIGFSIFNLFDRDNVKFRQFIYQFNPNNANIPINAVLGNQILQLGRTVNTSFAAAI